LPIDEVWSNDAIMDAGTKTVEMLKAEIQKAHYVLWNGPLGAYEGGFKQATIELAKALADSSAKTIVGGGDTLATIAELNLEDKFTFVSTGGGAMLEFLAKETLVGIEALNKY
jgi:phosphoglycerate kinase